MLCFVAKSMAPKRLLQSFNSGRDDSRKIHRHEPFHSGCSTQTESIEHFKIYFPLFLTFSYFPAFD